MHFITLQNIGFFVILIINTWNDLFILVLLPVYEGFPILKKMWLKMKFPALEKKKKDLVQTVLPL